MKWRIKGIRQETSFFEASKIILSARLKVLLQSIRDYFGGETVEKLHQVRIALRRLRYTLEVFYICIDQEVFTRIYKRIETLQDITGEVRDLDVLKENILSLSEGKIKLSTGLLSKLEEKRSYLNEQLRLELMKFIHSQELKDFKKNLKKQQVIR